MSTEAINNLQNEKNPKDDPNFVKFITNFGVMTGVVIGFVVLGCVSTTSNWHCSCVDVGFDCGYSPRCLFGRACVELYSYGLLCLGAASTNSMV